MKGNAKATLLFLGFFGSLTCYSYCVASVIIKKFLFSPSFSLGVNAPLVRFYAFDLPGDDALLCFDTDHLFEKNSCKSILRKKFKTRKVARKTKNDAFHLEVLECKLGFFKDYKEKNGYCQGMSLAPLVCGR